MPARQRFPPANDARQQEDRAAAKQAAEKLSKAAFLMGGSHRDGKERKGLAGTDQSVPL
jgi:hypothetical protein